MNRKDKEYTLNATTLSPGIAIGVAFPYHDILTRDISSYGISETDVAYELKRIANAFADVRKDLYELGRTVSHTISSENANIFEAQRVMIEDEQFGNSFEEELKNELINAEQVTKNVFRKQIERFEASSHEAVRAKADDLRDIFRKVLRSLLGIETSILVNLPQNAIIVARRLLPSDTVNLDQKNVEGILVQEGSVHGHSALLARSLGIPALCTNGKPLSAVSFGYRVIIDGYSHTAIINPSDRNLAIHQKKKKASSLEIKKKARVIRTIVKTKGGKAIRILANANTLEEVSCAVKSGCDGIGLFRTETIYLQRKSMPCEDDLFECLKGAIEPVGDMPVAIRLLDIGGDKRLPYFDFNDEFSPFLGLRGIRLLLKNPELLNTQLRALLKLATIRDVRILLPMISIPEEIVAVREMVRSCHNELRATAPKDTIQIGSMIETPSSALAINKIVEVSDFISIGTNDLTQYVMAASRENPSVADLYEKGFDYIVPLIRNVANVCKASHRECSVCGETANVEASLKKIIECGITQFSVSPFRIPHLKSFVRKLDL